MNSDNGGWWRRKGTPKRFRYIGMNGRPLTADGTVARIEAMVIPPAWSDVHISPDPARKVQAFGRDAAGRKQYIYSDEHVRRTDRRKWRRVQRVAQALPTLRAVTNEHLKRKDLDREKVLATVVRLMCRAYFRASSERYAVQNKTFGICTLGKKHVEIRGDALVFTYKGKRSKDQRQVVAETPLVEIIDDLMDLPGRRLFQFPAEDGVPKGRGARRRLLKPVTAAAVNRYLRDSLGERFTSKDLRTFGGTVRAATILADIGPAHSPTEAKRNVALCCKLVSLDLGNTPAIARKAYIHPAVLEEYERAGRTAEPLAKKGRGKKTPEVEAEEPVGYYPEEIALMWFLERYG
jgi:DNA topoisomerase-1